MKCQGAEISLLTWVQTLARCRRCRMALHRASHPVSNNAGQRSALRVRAGVDQQVAADKHMHTLGPAIEHLELFADACHSVSSTQ